MHLLAVQPGRIDDGSEAVDPGQTPGEIVVLSTADSELACLARARADLPADFPALRLANLLQLRHNLSVDLYVERIVGRARLVCVRLLGGRGYWPYGIDEIAACCRDRGIALALLPGCGNEDADFAAMSTLDGAARARLQAYGDHGGIPNARNFLLYAADLIGRADALPGWAEPAPLLSAGLYWPGAERADLAMVTAQWQAGAPTAALLFYRALVQSGGTAAVDAMTAALQAEGVNPLPVFVQSLKDGFASDLLAELFAGHPPDVIVNCTSFAVAVPGAGDAAPPGGADCPVLQAVLAAGDRDGWAEGSTGLTARDMAMNVALPEVDGRILSRAIAFKAQERFDTATEWPIVAHLPEPDRVRFVAAQAGRWARLRRTPAAERRLAVVLANYPNRDGRLGNGVGLDTPASAVAVLQALREAGYAVEGIPADGDALMRDLSAGPTSEAVRDGGAFLPLDDYLTFLDGLPAAVGQAVTARWGAPEADPTVAVRDGAAGFVLPVLAFGRTLVGIQPARGRDVDALASYHDLALVPPHAYLAFYAWLRTAFDAHAVIHLGKHGTLEWLPGKALALSAACYPEAALGPLPHLYPFIVNDPGEGSQAKRRSAAVIVDHLTPPLTRAESYGPLKDLEALVDEYYDAAQGDPRRVEVLRGEILALMARIGLDRDLEAAARPVATAGDGGDPAERQLQQLDAYLCELKELQIRDGLHVFGRAPEGRQCRDLLVALARLPRGHGRDGQASLLRALATDLGLESWDPLEADPAAPWTGPFPPALAAMADGPWRIAGDTVERLELLAAALVEGARAPESGWRAAAAVLAAIEAELRPAVAGCGAAELAGLLRGLDGRFVAPGPSGAPTRGRPEVLPTGRNFYSVDTRSVPTPAAWSLGWASAQLLVEDYLQRHGDWPRRMALTGWGTANMRTGGDDIAQALALMGVRPTWDAAARRVTGFEVLPLSALGRPRIDVTFRVSGFFRDAFPAQIDLLDSAARAVIALDEPAEENPLAAAAADEARALRAAGMDGEKARLQSGWRVFGSAPGSYGAGLQGMIDSGQWRERGDLAAAYLAGGGYAYGAGREGEAAGERFAARLAGAEAVVQNQDNREHDLLDSGEYYEFEGGMAAAVAHLRGAAPEVYHNDHAQPGRPRIRRLEDELARILRGRAANPKWIAGAMRHGYKGAFEMAASVDYLYAFAATTGLVKDHQFDLLFDAYLDDPAVRDFLARSNPAALREMAARFEEAVARGLWRPQSNSARDTLAALAAGGAGRQGGPA